MDSTQLFLALKNVGVKADADGPFWWPGAGTFEVVVGAVLIQNTNWKNADKALNNLKNANLMSLDGIVKTPAAELALLIKPSGFYNTKAKRLKTLCEAIFKKFGDFENFKENVSREWLLGIKGIGAESCDAVLCYACGREVMVVDSYALRILSFLGYEFESYEEAREWLEAVDSEQICEAYGRELEMNEIYAKFHGKIVEFCKAHFNGKKLDEAGEKILKNLT